MPLPHSNAKELNAFLIQPGRRYLFHLARQIDQHSPATFDFVGHNGKRTRIFVPLLDHAVIVFAQFEARCGWLSLVSPDLTISPLQRWIPHFVLKRLQQSANLCSQASIYAAIVLSTTCNNVLIGIDSGIAPTASERLQTFASLGSCYAKLANNADDRGKAKSTSTCSKRPR